MTIPPTGDNNVVYIVEGEIWTVTCLQTLVVLLAGYSGIFIIIYIPVSVTTVPITPGTDNNVVYILEGEMWTVICDADSSRAASWIQWYNCYYLYFSTGDNSDNHTSW